MSNTLRQVSGSIGTSVITTIFTTRTTFHGAAYADRMDTTNPTFMQSFGELVNKIATELHIPVAQAKTQAVTMLAGHVKMEATVQGINDAFFWATLISVAGLVLSFFLRDVRKDKDRLAKKERKETLMLPAPKETLVTERGV
ncbi:hypothetical protein D3C85_1128480 [compost metagenome]